MKPVGIMAATGPTLGWPFCALAAWLGVLAAVAQGAPPIDPLPDPLFSFGAGSPTVVGQGVGANGILGLNLPNLETRFQGWAFGLGLYADDLDAHSLGNADLTPDAPFALLFSVDDQSVGLAAPDPALVELGVPYNAQDQASRGQAAGDQFMSTRLFTRTGAMGTIALIDLSNNVLVRNNFDEGGTDFVASPASSAIDILPIGGEQDRVDATTTPLSGTDIIYFSATADSPSLSILSDPVLPSGANIFVFVPPGSRTTLKAGSERPPRGQRAPFQRSCETLCEEAAQQAYNDCIAQGSTPADCQAAADAFQQACYKSECEPPCQASCCQQADQAYIDCIDTGGTVEECALLARQLLWDCLENECGVAPPASPGLFASFSDLGLQQDDDIDGLVVFDANGDGTFNGDDRVLFSLTASSPSLGTLPGASAMGAAADVFLVAPGRQTPTLFAGAFDLGLGHESDNIDALDFTLCTDGTACATAHGIRIDPPIPTVSTWGVITLTLLLLTAGSLVVLRPRQALPPTAM
jgi:hypothetical protein